MVWCLGIMIKIMHKNKNVLYIDAANLMITAKEFRLEYDLFQLLLYFKDKYRINKCYYFSGNFSKQKKDFDLLQKYGVDLILKEVYFDNGKTKANCDVEISHQITFDVENNLVEKVILISGDGDFCSLLKYVQGKNINTKLFAIHPKSTSYLYKRNHGEFDLTYLSQIISRVSIKRKDLAEHVASERLLFDNSNISKL